MSKKTLEDGSLTIGFIGFGLIGGSIARCLKNLEHPPRILACSRTRSHLNKAMADGILDGITDRVDDSFSLCDIVLLCTPVEYNADYLKQLKEVIHPGTIISDVGSTKTRIHEEVIRLGMEDFFIGGHPMAGSEKTGYENSSIQLLENAYYILTPSAHSAKEDLALLTDMVLSIHAIPLVLDYRKHDRIVASISHLPHIIASSLVNLVKASDGPKEEMKLLAAGGFKDITRIASASPEMWEQICMTNQSAILETLDRYLDSLVTIRREIKEGNQEAIHKIFQTSRDYRNSFSGKARGSLIPDYSFSVDIADEPGAISTLSVILAARGISISNIGINHNRENGEGALRITFYDEASMKLAWEQLTRYHYDLIHNL